MSKFFDFLCRWGERMYEARRESLENMYHFEELSEKDTRLTDLPKSPHNVLKMKIVNAHN